MRGGARIFGHHGGQRGGGHGAPQAHSAPPPQARPSPSHAPEPSHVPEARSGTSSYGNTQPNHPGQQHLPEWFNSHQNMTPQQRENALRREPGFNNLPATQQQRLINRLHSLDEKTPEQRQRILQRNENFEHLSPERQQEVRGAAQALGQMSPERQQALRGALQQLRHMPPQERQQMLNSQAYGSRFSPQERTVLGNLLSIEPYQRPGTIPSPTSGDSRSAVTSGSDQWAEERLSLLQHVLGDKDNVRWTLRQPPHEVRIPLGAKGHINPHIEAFETPAPAADRGVRHKASEIQMTSGQPALPQRTALVAATIASSCVAMP